MAVEPATVEPAAPFELAAGRQAGTTAVPTMEHFLGKRPDPATVDEIEINDWRDVARRLGIAEDLVHELDTVVNHSPAKPVGGFQLLPADATPDQAHALYPVEAAVLAWMHDLLWHQHQRPTIGGLRVKLDELRAEHAPPRFRPAGQADLAPSGEKARIRANLAALETLRTIQAAHRPATAEEQKILGRWSGWGAVPNALDERKDDYQWVRNELAGLLSTEEFAAARRTVLNAHYTDAALVSAIWEGLADLGFAGGRVLEPGCGSGNFIAFAPDGAEITGVELDPTTAAIAAALYPEANILAESFADTRAREGSFDAAVGNVPFADVRLHDKAHNRGRHAIHNHFILKSLALTRPGGLVAVITSAYTMDATNPAARRELQAMGDLVGAVRLPSRAHRRAAGTDALTDVLIFRRREPDRESASFDWEYAHPVEVDGVAVNVNDYFTARPGQVLGRLAVGDGLYRRDELSVAGDPATAGTDLRQALSAIATDARAAELGMSDRTVALAPRPVARVADDPRRPDGYIRANADGTFSIKKYGTFEPYTPPKSQATELRELLGLRDTVVALLEAEATTIDDTDAIDELRAKLNTRYTTYAANYGPINRFELRPRRTKDKATGRMVPVVDEETGLQEMRRVRPPQGHFRDDPFAPVVAALENFDEETQTAARADIFSQRVVSARSPRLGADTPEEALAISLDTSGEVRLSTVAWLLGVDEPTARQRLGTLVYDNPATSKLEPAAAYLSGDVKTKLDIARLAADQDDRYTVNVTALTEVVPADVDPSDVVINMGAPWIGADRVQQFLRELLDDPSVSVEHGEGAMWTVTSRGQGGAATQEWSTDDRAAVDIAQTILEQRQFVIRKTVRGSDGSKREVLDVEAIVEATEKAAEMRSRFAEWVWDDADRAGELLRIYNDRFNRHVERTYEGSYLTLPGLAKSFTPDKHQLDAVARIIHEPAVGLYHVVGAGKTATMIMGAMELRRLGLVRKPSIVVPNHLLDQWSRDFLALYPQAKVLAVGSEDLGEGKGGGSSRERRRLLVAKIATGDWDAVILTESAFKMLPMSSEVEQNYLDARLGQLDNAIATAEANGNEQTLKRLERMRARREAREVKKLDAHQDPGICFDRTGIDYLFRDESHRDKNLETASNVPGMSIDGSERATQMDLKLRWLRDTKARWGTRATGTPLANSIVEIYTDFRYLRPDLMEALGIPDIDSWLATFAEGKPIIEVTPDGGGLRTKVRLEFVNLGELIRHMRVFADVKMAEDLNLPRPVLPERADGLRLPEVVVVPPSTELLDVVAGLVERAEKLRGTRPEKGEDNILKIVGEGAAAALDLRLLGLQTTEPQKLDVSADRIAGIHHANADNVYLDDAGEPSPTPGALQIVFCDLGTPKPKADDWSAYAELRRLLVERGIPRHKIRFIHEAADDRARAELFTACRDGRVSVLIGSTEKMGTGVNVQARLIALHHLDPVYRPCDLEQRDGRGLRRGNQNPEVAIIRYVTEKSLDPFKWQKVEQKGRQADRLLRGIGPSRMDDVSDMTLSAGEFKAASTGNQLLIDHERAKYNAARLRTLERSFRRSQSQLRFSIKSRQQDIGIAHAVIREIDEALPRRRDTRGDAFSINIRNHVYTKRSEANDRLRGAIGLVAAQPGRDIEIGSLGGFAITAQAERDHRGSPQRVHLALRDVPMSEMTLALAELGETDIVTRLENRIRGLDKLHADTAARIPQLEARIAREEEELAKPFRRQAELDEAEETLRHLDAQVAALALESEQAANAGEAVAEAPDGADADVTNGAINPDRPAHAMAPHDGPQPAPTPEPTPTLAPTATIGDAAVPPPATPQPATTPGLRAWLVDQINRLADDTELTAVARNNDYSKFLQVAAPAIGAMVATVVEDLDGAGYEFAARFFDDRAFGAAFTGDVARALFDHARSGQELASLALPTIVESIDDQFSADETSPEETPADNPVTDDLSAEQSATRATHAPAPDNATVDGDQVATAPAPAAPEPVTPDPVAARVYGDRPALYRPDRLTRDGWEPGASPYSGGCDGLASGPVADKYKHSFQLMTRHGRFHLWLDSTWMGHTRSIDTVTAFLEAHGATGRQWIREEAARRVAEWDALPHPLGQLVTWTVDGTARYGWIVPGEEWHAPRVQVATTTNGILDLVDPGEYTLAAEPGAPIAPQPTVAPSDADVVEPTPEPETPSRPEPSAVEPSGDRGPADDADAATHDGELVAAEQDPIDAVTWAAGMGPLMERRAQGEHRDLHRQLLGIRGSLGVPDSISAHETLDAAEDGRLTRDQAAESLRRRAERYRSDNKSFDGQTFSAAEGLEQIAAQLVGQPRPIAGVGVDVDMAAEPLPRSWQERITIAKVDGRLVVSGTTGAPVELGLRDLLKKHRFRWVQGAWRRYGQNHDVALAEIRQWLAEADRAEAAKASSQQPSYPPTEQQQKIIDAYAAGKDVAVHALAGTGKTSTLVFLANVRPAARVVYIAFNRPIADEAETKFPRNVTVGTSHRFARQGLQNTPLRDKLQTAGRDKSPGARFPSDWARVLDIRDVDEPLPVDAEGIARAVMGTVRNFRQSADAKISRHHLPDVPAEIALQHALIVEKATAAWRDISDPNGRLFFDHDDYLKIWALGSPRLPFDVIFFDEAQDINDVLRKVVLDQPVQTVVVGDSYQSIYGFRGAKDALKKWPADVKLPLTQSWRFGPGVAGVGNRFLRLLRSDLELTGNPALDTTIGPVDEPGAVLASTNAGAVAAVFDALDAGRRTALVGGGDTIRDIAKAAQDLQAGRGTKHPELSQFSTWDEVQEFVDKDDDGRSLRAFVRLVDRRGADGLLEMVGRLVSEDGVDKDGNPLYDVIVSTIHKSKGLEYDRVRIADDFPRPSEDPETGKIVLPDAEALRLAYVAVTRARVALELGGLSWIADLTEDDFRQHLGSRNQHTAVAQAAADMTDVPRQSRDEVVPAAPREPDEPTASGGSGDQAPDVAQADDTDTPVAGSITTEHDAQERRDRVRQRQLILRIELDAPKYHRVVPGGAGRYISEIVNATREEWNWIARYIEEHPEILHGPERSVDEIKQYRLTEARDAWTAAEKAFEAGDYRQVLDRLDTAEVFQPEGFTTVTGQYVGGLDELREMVRRRLSDGGEVTTTQVPEPATTGEAEESKTSTPAQQAAAVSIPAERQPAQPRDRDVRQATALPARAATVPPTTTETVDAQAPVPPGATIICPRLGCGRQTTVKRDGTIAAHYMYGRQPCKLVDKPVPAGTHIVRLSDRPKGATTATEDLFAHTADEQSAEERLREQVAAHIPADAILAQTDGRPAVLLSVVANGTYGEVTGVDLDRRPTTATGYIVESRGVRGGYGGWHPDTVMYVKLADRPDGPVTHTIQAELDARIRVAENAEADVPAGADRPLLRMPVEEQILAARDALGLTVEVLQGLHNAIWRVDGCPEQLTGEVARWLFGGRYGSWEGRAHPVFRPELVAAAIAAGRIPRGPDGPADEDGADAQSPTDEQTTAATPADDRLDHHDEGVGVASGPTGQVRVADTTMRPGVRATRAVLPGAPSAAFPQPPTGRRAGEAQPSTTAAPPAYMFARGSSQQGRHR